MHTVEFNQARRSMKRGFILFSGVAILLTSCAGGEILPVVDVRRARDER